MKFVGTREQDPEFLNMFKYSLIGGLSGICATTFVHPADTIKVACQVANESHGLKGERQVVNPLSIIMKMFKESGIRSFYKGFDCSLFKQLTYSTARLGVYKYLYDKGIKENGEVSFLKKIQYSLVAGVVATITGCPADMTMVRFQSDFGLPESQRRNYRHIFDAFNKIVRSEGVLSLWTGVQYSMIRVIAATVSQLTTFEEVKERTRRWRGVEKDDIYNRMAAAAVSGLACTLTALPFDNMKVKYQKMKQLPDGSWEYKTLLDVFSKTYKREGIFGFWTGIAAFYLYVAPHTLITLISQDYFHILLSRNKEMH